MTITVNFSAEGINKLESLINEALETKKSTFQLVHTYSRIDKFSVQAENLEEAKELLEQHLAKADLPIPGDTDAVYWKDWEDDGIGYIIQETEDFEVDTVQDVVQAVHSKWFRQ